MSFETQLGAYVEYPQQFRTYQVERRICCGKNYGEERFCSECGKEIETTKIDKKNELVYWDMLGEGMDELSQLDNKGTTYLYTNHGLGISLDSIHGEGDLKEITPQTIEDCKEAFAIRYKYWLQLLEEYLDMKLEIKFGFIGRYW